MMLDRERQHLERSLKSGEVCGREIQKAYHRMPVSVQLELPAMLVVDSSWREVGVVGGLCVSRCAVSSGWTVKTHNPSRDAIVYEFMKMQARDGLTTMDRPKEGWISLTGIRGRCSAIALARHLQMIEGFDPRQYLIYQKPEVWLPVAEMVRMSRLRRTKTFTKLPQAEG